MASSTTKTIFSRFSLPGLNLPLNWTPHKAFRKSEYVDGGVRTVSHPGQGEENDLFRTALSNADVTGGYTSLPLTTLREFTMLHIMNALTDKPGWEEKVFDETISQKWKDEALETEGRDVTKNMVDWVIDELRWKAKIFKETGVVVVYNGDVVKSDVAVPQSVKEALQAAARQLEDIPERFKDWHPGSDGKVLDIVHPSLFPLIYGRSRVLEDSLIGLDDCIENCGKGTVAPIRDVEETWLDRKGSRVYNPHRHSPTPPYGNKFQWLPCEVDISSDDGSAKIASYINNLHPHKHRDLYSIIEQVIAKAIPQWNATLTPLWDHNYFPRIKITHPEFDPDPDQMGEDEKPQQEEDEDDMEYWDRRDTWERELRTAVQPEPGNFTPYGVIPDHLKKRAFVPDTFEWKDPVDLRKNYGHRGLQVIVKLANIELTPEKPEYEGGTWHVEGQLNEHICATALYYYDSENITESHLAFRQQASADDARDMPYPQGQHDWLTEIFGCDPNGPTVQDVGSVVCREGRLLTFPNILQHQVQPFTLADPTKKGHRKILALFLVDPGIRIISTANVPPQRKDWWSEEVMKGMYGSGKGLGKLSTEIKDKVFDDVDEFPIGMEEAKEIRLKLMDERSVYVTEHKGIFEQNTFSLCEH